MSQCPMDKSNEEKPMDKLDEDKLLEAIDELLEQCDKLMDQYPGEERSNEPLEPMDKPNESLEPMDKSNEPLESIPLRPELINLMRLWNRSGWINLMRLWNRN
ncbi:hypothetical protein TNCV_1178661 [Trichonephila clavipes]|nr:hypothetical protein TNCV_1178661 [Trichonephila clavipes]